MIELPCGCEVEVDHTQADRYVECACGKAWIVNAHQVIHITYTVKETRKRVAA